MRPNVPAFAGVFLTFSALFFPSASASVDGRVSFEYGIQPSAVGQVRKSEGWLGAQLGWKWKDETGDRWRLQALIASELLVLSPATSAANSQTLGSTSAGEWNRSGSPHYFEDQELFVEYRTSRLRTSFGSRVLRWGISDFYDPLDQVNSRRMERPVQAGKRGEWMVRSEWSPRSTFSFEAFVIPQKRGAILPSQTSAWLPRQLYIPNLPDTEYNLPSSLEYKYREREARDSSLQWNTGARALWRPGEAEITFQYDEGASSFPSVRPSVSGVLIGITPEGRRVIQADPLIELTEVNYRERHYGASLVQPFGVTLLRAQFGKTEPMFAGRTLAHDRSDVSVALEHPVGLGSWGQLTVLAQGFKNLLEDESGGTDIASFSKIFDRAAALGLRFAASETSSFTVGGLTSLIPKGGTIVMSALTFDINSTVSAELAWTWFEAKLDSPMGPFKDNDGGSAKLTASF